MRILSEIKLICYHIIIRLNIDILMISESKLDNTLPTSQFIMNKVRFLIN